MTKPNFELKMGKGNKDYKLVIAPHQKYSEDELVSEITPILNHINPLFDDETGHLRVGLSDHKYLESEFKWILSSPDQKGVRHRVGLLVTQKYINMFVTELIHHGYRVFPTTSVSSPYRH